MPFKRFSGTDAWFEVVDSIAWCVNDAHAIVHVHICVHTQPMALCSSARCARINLKMAKWSTHVFIVCSQAVCVPLCMIPLIAPFGVSLPTWRNWHIQLVFVERLVTLGHCAELRSPPAVLPCPCPWSPAVTITYCYSHIWCPFKRMRGHSVQSTIDGCGHH